MSYQHYLAEPKISTQFVCNHTTSKDVRIAKAILFLDGMEYVMPLPDTLEKYEAIENILKSKVLTYAIAFAGGATNGGLLYQNARANLLTWHAIFEGAVFIGGKLA